MSPREVDSSPLTLFSAPLSLAPHRPPPTHTTMAGGGADPTRHIWSPAGGWYSDPRHWRRNTALAFLGLAGAAFYIGRLSARKETRHAAPVRPIPSRRWSDVPAPRGGAIGGAP